MAAKKNPQFKDPLLVEPKGPMDIRRHGPGCLCPACQERDAKEREAARPKAKPPVTPASMARDKRQEAAYLAVKNALTEQIIQNDNIGRGVTLTDADRREIVASATARLGKIAPAAKSAFENVARAILRSVEAGEKGEALKTLHAEAGSLGNSIGEAVSWEPPPPDPADDPRALVDAIMARRNR